LKIFYVTVADGSQVSYHENHVPTARFIDLNYLRNMTSKYPMMLPGASQFIDTMKVNGIKKTTRVVLYDNAAGYYATRMYWMLRVYGHENASVLDGGFGKWKAEGRMVETTPGFEVNGGAGFDFAFKPELYRYFEQVVQLSKDIKAGDTTEQITDARPQSSYDQGHIDEAISLWYKLL
jgi:thiosulfate/3-mercaptopyruvate sulfurtransferase